MLLINLSNQTEIETKVLKHVNNNLRAKEKSVQKESCSIEVKVSQTGKSASDKQSFREEYHLTPKDGQLQTQTSLLNGNPLNVTDGELPRLDPVLSPPLQPIRLAPLSIAFIVIPNFEAPACA